MFAKDVSVRFPQRFDVARLNQDLVTSERFEFAAHPLRYHDGTWTAINLYYAGGKTQYTHEGELGYGEEPAAPTEVLAACPYFQEVLASLPGRIIMARLSALPPGGRILRHYDPVESADFGQLRLHIPIRSEPEKVIFHLGFRRQYWRAGELWYGDFSFPHSVHNTADYTRVSMIIDIADLEPYRECFPPEYFSAESVARRGRWRDEMRSWSWRFDRVKEKWRKIVARDDKAA
ncbi:MAG: aspartyl/asparaginyl beta-hydroxylase domain-containing protein [Gammaproteobacteria bacterium]